MLNKEVIVKFALMDTEMLFCRENFTLYYFIF